MAFVLQDVINEIEETRSLEPLKKFKKENLVKVAAHYGITPAVGATKSHILNLIKDHCVENDIIDEVEEKPIAETAEIVRLKLDFEREERRLAREAEKALQDAQFAEAQKAREAAEAEAEKARELRLAELKEARELRELELKAEQEKALLAAEIEAKKEAAAREHELKMAGLGKHSPSDKASVFDPARNIRLVPPFQEKEVDKYFAHFEKVADSLNWPKESWVLLLQSVLVGKAQEIYGSLSVEQSSNYEHVKEAILKAYELVPEAYRQKFRNYLKYDSKTHVEFAREKENLFNRWCHSKEIGQDFKKLKQMVLLEEFKDKVRPDIRSHLDEQKVEELEKAAIMADDYALTHKMSSKSGNPQQKRYHGSGNRENVSRNMDDRKRQGKSTENVGLVSKVEPLKPISCGHCGKPGHIITNCWKLGGKTPCEHCGRFNHKSEDCRIAKNKLQKEVKPTGLTSLKGLKVSPFNESENSKGVKVKPLIDRNSFVEKNKGIKVNPLHNDKSCIEDEISPNTESDYMENYKPFISKGVVSLVGDENSSQKVKILRDTGATQSLMLDSVLPLTEKSFTGANVLISGVEMGVLEVPLHEVNIKSSLINGNIVIGMRPSLPVEGISLILGNDLAGEKVMVDPRVVEKPRDDEETERLAEKFPGIFPASVVTRSMKAKEEAIKEQGKEEIGLSGTFLENIDGKFEERNKEKADKALMRKESRNVKENIPEKQESESKSVISRQNLIEEQSNDKELLDLFKIALTPVEAEKVSVGYLIKDDILMRKWSPTACDNNEKGETVYQIVVPTVYRREVLELAHDLPMSGHLGVRKTYNRVLQHFFWPGLKRDVAKWCRECHTCQLGGKPNQNIPQAPLHPIPVFDEPFSHIIIDCVGPLPKTKSQNEFLLTIMCSSTRFPEAIPLRSIKTNAILKALIKFFTIFGLPKSIQSDQGTNFMAHAFQQVMNQLGIKQYKSSAYHPESQGALERFHQTLKTMIRMYCTENSRDWDEGVHLLLFAVRESVQESLGFSPFELVFGHAVRGPLLLLKEKWLDEDPEKISVLKYVATFKDRLFRAGQMAKRNLQESQSKMKVWYDRKAKSRCFEPGDRVLVLFPVVGNPLQAKYSGPYKVVKKISDTNYLVKTPDRRKETQVCHINMLKAYHEKPKPELVTLNNRLGLESLTHSKDCVGQVAEKEEDTESEVRLGNDQQPIKLQNSQILNDLDTKLSHLPSVQRKELAEVITQYREVFPDVPSKTNLIEHDVDVGDSAPIKQHPYRVSPMKKELLDKEVQYMLKNDIIEESQSNWSSPCILVPKHDGGFRFCTDFRKVNDKTKSDSFPIPRIADCIDQIGNAKFVSTFDMLKGYWQVPLTQRAREISAFVTPSGLYQYKVMPFGMKNAPATFQRMVNKLVRDIDGCEGYIDDVVIYSDNWSDHIHQIKRFFQIMREAKLTINLMKSEFGKATVKYLGHIVGQGQVRPLDAKIQTIAKFPIPTSRKELARFLGMAGYYRNFCLNFSDIAAPLTNLLSKKVKFVWTDDCQMAFDKVKLLLQKSPVLKSPDYEKPFKLIIDSSDVGTGSVLVQEASDGLDHPVSYFSKKFLKYQKNYSVVEKETLGLVLALEHFDVYLGSTPFKIKVYTDHNPLTFLKTMKNKNQRLVRWSLALQEYNLEIQHIPGSENVVADALSRCIG